MKTRPLGSQGLDVSAIGLGCMGMTIQYGEHDDVEAAATLNHALDIGVNLINTADVYGNGKNETLIAQAIGGRRDEMILTTKFGNKRTPDFRATIDGSPEYVHKACDASLQRLGTDHIDLYCQHRVDPQVPIEDTVGAMAELIQQGKVRYIGLSEAGADTIRRAHATHPITCLETEYSLWTRDVEVEILPLCRELGIGFVAYAPIGRGFLSATFSKPEDLIDADRRLDHPRFSAENMAANLGNVQVLAQIAENYDCTPAQLAIAWVIAQADNIVPIPGTQRRSYLDLNAQAAGIVLKDEDDLRLKEVFEVGGTAGDRYPGGAMKHLGN